jgi:orotate phosphoribosyltransferase
MAPEGGLLDTLRHVGALKEGHFLLASGRHSDQYIEKFDLLRCPAATSAACAQISAKFKDRSIDVVVGPTTGGVILAFEVARQLQASAAYAERSEVDPNAREFRRGTTFPANARVLVLDDILTTGGSIRETLAALHDLNVEVAAVAVLVDRSSKSIDFGVPSIALASLAIASWEPENCPLCRVGMPLTKPGSTPNADRHSA